MKETLRVLLQKIVNSGYFTWGGSKRTHLGETQKRRSQLCRVMHCRRTKEIIVSKALSRSNPAVFKEMKEDWSIRNKR